MIVVHQIERLKKSLERSNQFIELLYERVYENEDAECRQLLKDIKDTLDKQYIEALIP